MGPKSDVKYPYKRNTKERDGEKKRKEGHVKGIRDWTDAAKSFRIPETTRAERNDSPRLSTALPTP